MSAERIKRLQQQRAAVGRAPTIQSVEVYALLSACVDAQRSQPKKR